MDVAVLIDESLRALVCLGLGLVLYGIFTSLADMWLDNRDARAWQRIDEAVRRAHVRSLYPHGRKGTR